MLQTIFYDDDNDNDDDDADDHNVRNTKQRLHKKLLQPIL